MPDGDGEGAAGVASNFIWAIAMIIVVALIVGAVYYGGFFRGTQKKEIDVEIKVPTR